MLDPSPPRVAALSSPCATLLGAALVLALNPSAARAFIATDLLAHFESECFDGGGCTQTATPGTEVEFGFDIFPDATLIATLSEAETIDTTIIAPDYLNDYFTSGSLAAPEGLFFTQRLVGGGGGGRGTPKDDFRDGFLQITDTLRIEFGYDVPLANGIDLAGTAEVTDVRLQVFLVDLPDSPLGGTALRTHWRVEILGVLVPEPSTALLAGLALAVCAARRTR